MRSSSPSRWVLFLVSGGGVVGALCRYGLERLWAGPPDGIPWATLTANLTGCLLIGAVTAWLAARRAPAWCRPMIGVGFLGGYTTFSAYAVQWVELLESGRVGPAVAYLLGTVVGAMLAVYAGAALVRTALGRGRS